MIDFLVKMYQNSTEAIFFLDEEGNILSLNPTAEQIIDPSLLQKIKGGNINSLCSFCRGYTSDEHLMTCVHCYLKDPESDFTSFQVYLETNGKGIVPYAASYHMIDEENGVYVFMLRDLTLQYKKQELVYRNKMLQKTIDAQEKERRRISRELHDSVVQELISTLVDIRVMRYMDEKDILKKIDDTEGTLNRLIEDIRDLSVFLRPASLDDLGLEAAFRSHFKWVKQTYGIEVSFTSTIKQRRYLPNMETTVYRICQEAVLNAVKYAKVAEITVILTESEDRLELYVRDKGEGFDVDHPTVKGSGIGLFGMKERAELINGKLKVHSEHHKGTTVFLSVPIPNQLEEE